MKYIYHKQKNYKILILIIIKKYNNQKQKLDYIKEKIYQIQKMKNLKMSKFNIKFFQKKIIN